MAQWDPMDLCKRVIFPFQLSSIQHTTGWSYSWQGSNSHPSTFQAYFSPGLPRKGLGESYMFVSQPLWRFFCIVITSLSRLLREHFPGLYWRAWRCRT
jgi:hypothetical protein